jgi:hypothetical protein
MTQPSLGPNYPGGNPWRFYWIGTVFDDGSFYQVGYQDRPKDSDCAGLEWFSQGFDALGHRILVVDGGCGTTGARAFSMEFSSFSPSTGKTTWVSKMSGNGLPGTAFSTFDTSFPLSFTYVVSEVSTVTNIYTAGLPSVTYDSAIQKYSGGSWFDIAHGVVYRGSGSTKAGPCPPYYVSDGGFDNLRVFSSSSTLTCHASGVALW